MTGVVSTPGPAGWNARAVSGSTPDGPADSRLPDGFTVALDRRVRRIDGGAALLGGAPPRLVHLGAAAVALLGGTDRITVADATTRALSRRLLDTGLAHPVAAGGAVDGAPAGAELVTVVVPVKDRPLDRLLAALPPGLGGLVVVDDGSDDPEIVARGVVEAGGKVLRHPSPRGPAAARNAGLAASATPFVAFLDSDVVPRDGWLGPLLAHTADPAVGARRAPDRGARRGTGRARTGRGDRALRGRPVVAGPGTGPGA